MIETYEDFLDLLDTLVEENKINVCCPECRTNITVNYKTRFNEEETRCHKCNSFYDNESVLYIPI